MIVLIKKEAIIEGNEAWSEDADTHIYINRVMIICVIGFETDKEQKENDRFSWWVLALDQITFPSKEKASSVRSYPYSLISLCKQETSLIFFFIYIFVWLFLSPTVQTFLLWMEWDFGLCYNENMMMKIIILVLGKDKGLHRETARERERGCMGSWDRGHFWNPAVGLGGDCLFFSLSHNSYAQNMCFWVHFKS